MNMMNWVVNAGTFIGKAGVELLKIGGWGVLNQYTNQQFRNGSQHFIGEMERGAEYGARKLKLIKND